MIKRDWSIDIELPENENKDFLTSTIMGLVNHQPRNDKVNVLLCALPKSAGTHMTQLLASSLGYKNHQIGFNQRGGEIYYPRLLASKYVKGNTISHCHAIPTRNVEEMIRILGLKPVVLTRNLLDALVSKRDQTLEGLSIGVWFTP